MFNAIIGTCSFHRNSKPLPVSEGYWAEPWPVADTPLCAVIDPAHDYRWHALRCGGPETAAFLCEMESKFNHSIEQLRDNLINEFNLVPDWALHCTENPEITVQYISDSGAVQLSRHCQDSVKEISCQGKMNQMAMYDELKCPEEQTTITPTEITTVEFSSTTTEESHPEVIIKNPQKMLEDVFNNVETNMEIDSNRLDAVDAKKELDLMVGDQPADDTTEDKKTLLKLPEKKEVYPKKSKNGKKDSKSKQIDDEPMMADAPAKEVHDEHATTISSKPDGLTTERQRRDVADTTMPVEANVSSEVLLSTQHIDITTTENLSTISTELSTEAPQITSVVTEETTTKNIVQGHPLFHNHAIFKEPISVDNNNGTLERKDVSNTDDHFIPPMLLVKARFTATKSTEGTEETKEMTTDVSTSILTESTLEGQTVSETTDDEKNVTSKPTETNEISTNEISSITQLETTPALTSVSIEKPIVIEKRNDPRLGLNLNAITTSTLTPSTIAVELSSTELQSSSTTEEPSSTVSEEVSSSVSYESTVSEMSTTESPTEVTETSEASSSDTPTTTGIFDISTSTQPKRAAERLIESTTQKAESSSAIDSSSMTPIAIKLTTLKAPEILSPKPIKKSTTQMRNDIDNGHRHESSETSHELHESSDENESFEHHHLENNLNNADDYQPYKPNRHRSITQSDHHHGPAFSIGKILG